ncbi:MAG: nitrogen fixation protein NifZ [Rhodocyclaceae bacterium]|nr:nitrogen fixation protein NifZ [Rhodocyclaceae bacterium]
MLPRFDYGAGVRVTRNVRNDGTFPGLATGALLVRRGATGFVRDVGTFLQDQLIYTVAFLETGVPGDQDGRVIGCREEELIGVDEPWTPTRFESRETVMAAKTLVVGGELRAARGSRGEVMKVFRDAPGGPRYRVHFPGWVLDVPEAALAPPDHGTTGATVEYREESHDQEP